MQMLLLSGLCERAFHAGNSKFMVEKAEGARLYLDGALKGDFSSNAQYEGGDGVTFLATGGRPTVLDGPITLCTRADNTTGRFFNGNVVYLGKGTITDR
jgi:hypothetical protein